MPTLEPYVFKDENGKYYINGNPIEEFYYAPGDPIKQAFILNSLTSLGGENRYSLLCDDDSKIYYIDVNDHVIYECTNVSQMGILLTLYGTLVESVEINLSTTWEEHYQKYGYGHDPLQELWVNINNRLNTYTNETGERNLSYSYIAFMKLTFLRDEYRMDWLPDVSRDGSIWAVVYNDNELKVMRRNCQFNSHFSFQSEEIANMFLYYFKDLLDEAKYLMGYEDVICNINIHESENLTIAILNENKEDITSTLENKMSYNFKFYVAVLHYDTEVIEKPTTVIINNSEFTLYDNLLDTRLITEILINKCNRNQVMDIRVVEVPKE